MCESLDPVLENPPFECNCKTGYYGPECSTSTCQTQSNPCLNNASCSMVATGSTSAVASCGCQQNETGEWTGDTCDEFKPFTSIGKQMFGAVIGIGVVVAAGYAFVSYFHKRGQMLLGKKSNDKDNYIQHPPPTRKPQPPPNQNRNSRSNQPKFKTAALAAVAANRHTRVTGLCILLTHTYPQF